MANLLQLVMTREAKWDPCIYDDSHLSTNAHLARLPSTSVEATDRFYNHYGDHIQSYKSLTWSPSSEDTVKVPNKLDQNDIFLQSRNQSRWC